ncbi:MAG: hypothetical protein J6N49_02655 [Alphaproteobacteria bacterium]|nr:hypothetical protein [Alphaproteobacteria bacterium]
MQKIRKNEYVKLEDCLAFAGTIYESFEALEEVMGKLKLERPLFLVYLAKKAFAEEVYKAAGEPQDKVANAMKYPSYIEIQNPFVQKWQ